MNNEPVIRQYARALLEIADESGSLDTIKSDLSIIQGCVKDDPATFSLMSSPSLDRNKRKEVFEKSFSGKVSSVGLNFLKVVAYNNRQLLLDEIIDAFNSLLCKRNNEIEAVVESASPLSNEQKAILMDKLNKKYKRNFKLSFKENKLLLGGFTILFENTLIDNSIAGKVKKLRQEMTSI